jgi:hypothetical protein
VGLAWLFGPVYAQAALEIRYGLKTVLDISRHWSTEEKGGAGYSVESANRTGYGLGGILQVDLSPHFTLQPEVFFIRKGSVQNVTVAEVPIGPIKATYILDYIELPVILKTYFRARKEPLAPYLGAGPYLSFLVRDKYKFKNSVLGESEQKIEDLKTTDSGFVFVFGLDVHGPDALFSFGYRFSLGLVDLALPTGPGFPSIELRNQCHMFCLEVIF